MKIKSLTLNITDACNEACLYCPQTQEPLYLDWELLDQVIDFFPSYFDKECAVNFYGGEPLLAFDRIRYVVQGIEVKTRDTGKVIRYSLTTNGSLLNEVILEYMDKVHFYLMLSFDGIAQEQTRKKNSFHRMTEIIKQALTYKGISFCTNSVFTPVTVRFLFESIRLIIELGVEEPNFTLSIIEPWDKDSLQVYREQLSLLAEFFRNRYQETGHLPGGVFGKRERDEREFACMAARDRIAVAADGNVWGCYLFPDFFKDKTDTREYSKYMLGKLPDFIQNAESLLQEKLPNYIQLHQGNFYTDERFCAMCSEVRECKVCPISAARSGSIILGKLPVWICAINQIETEIRQKFHDAIL